MNTNLLSKSAILLILSLFLVGQFKPYQPADSASAATQTSTSVQYWPTQGWRTSTPEDQGMDSHLLAQMLDSITQDKLELHSLLIIRNGYIVSETYFSSYTQDKRHELYSCTKSFISTLVGIALDKGVLDGVNHPVLSYFPDKSFQNLDSLKEAMTVDDLLTMRSGLDWVENDTTYRAMYVSLDWVKYVLDEPMKAPAGTQFNYCTGCTHILSKILQKETGVGTRAFAITNLFEPLGIAHFDWDTDSSFTPVGGWGLHLTPRDMAKLGYLYLHNGNWDGQQIVSSAWVKTATQQHTTTDGSLGYGYQWWIYPSYGAYAALGLYGQMIFVAPKLNLIVVTTANIENHDPIFNLIDHYIVPAIKSDTPT